jgi:AcrR family transcriptional regulator
MVEVRPRSTSRSELRARIVGAAARLLREHGPTAVTTRGVAEAAGVQAPTIYRLFGDKDGLLDAVAEHELARYVTGKACADDSDDPIADLHTAWDRHVDFGLANPALFTLLVDPARAARSPAAAAGQDVLRDRVHRVATTGRLRVPEQRAVELIHAAGTGAVLTLLAQPAEDRDRRLADTLYHAVMRTVLTDTPTPTTDSAATVAVTLRAALSELSMLTPGEQIVLAEWLDRISTP